MQTVYFPFINSRQERPFLGSELLEPTKDLLESFVRAFGESSGSFIKSLSELSPPSLAGDTGHPHYHWSIVENMDSNRGGPGPLYHFEKVISSHFYRSRGPAPGPAMPVTCCTTLMMSHLQTSASLSAKGTMDKGFTSPPICLSGTLRLHQWIFLSLSLRVWNSHLDIILWVHPYQIPFATSCPSILSCTRCCPCPCVLLNTWYNYLMSTHLSS